MIKVSFFVSNSFVEIFNHWYFSDIQPGNRAFGEINCPNAQESDQGAYSCEAINSKGSCFAGSTGCGQPGQVIIF